MLMRKLKNKWKYFVYFDHEICMNSKHISLCHIYILILQYIALIVMPSIFVCEIISSQNINQNVCSFSTFNKRYCIKSIQNSRGKILCIKRVGNYNAIVSFIHIFCPGLQKMLKDERSVVVIRYFHPGIRKWKLKT